MTIAKKVEEFRKIFPVIIGQPSQKYEGSTMLYVPYEEVVHYLETSLREVEEEAKKEVISNLMLLLKGKAHFWDDSDHAVGGYISRKEVKDGIENALESLKS